MLLDPSASVTESNGIRLGPASSVSSPSTPVCSASVCPSIKLRSAVVAHRRPVPVAASHLAAVDAADPSGDTVTEPSDATPPSKPSKPKSRRPNYRWPELMRRSFGIDVLQCKDCGGVLKLVDIVTFWVANLATLRTNLFFPIAQLNRPRAANRLRPTRRL